MKKLVSISIFYLFCQNLNAQAFTVGNTCCNYNLVHKTFTTATTSTSNPWTGGSTDLYQFDVDGDLSNDIKIAYNYGYQNGSNGYLKKSLVITSATGVEFIYTSVGPGWYSQYVQNVSSGSFLDPSKNWNFTPASWGGLGTKAPVIYEYYTSTNITYTTGFQINPYYIGFRKLLPSNDTIYGWIQMDSNLPGKVIDYAYTCGSYTSAPQSSTISTASSVTCLGDSVLLSGTPSGGVFYGTGVSGNYFKSKYLTAGTYTVNYAIPNLSGCTTSPSTQTITVNACVGINELGGKENNFSIFPNPNNGEFEIKGIKEETIFISNELGQQVRTVELNSEKSFGTKISDLQSGIYFVGNKFYRQKVVVIK